MARAVADARHLTTWHARCLTGACRARPVNERVFFDQGAADRWVVDHARNGGRGGHPVALWCRVGGQRPWRAFIVRYSDFLIPVADWLGGWEWCCLTRDHPIRSGQGRDWYGGHLTPKSLLAAWWEHDCTGRTTDDQ